MFYLGPIYKDSLERDGVYPSIAVHGEYIIFHNGHRWRAKPR